MAATLRDGKGDLVRVLGMKIVALLALMRALDEELMVLSKLGKVCHISYSTAARVDAQYKVGTSQQAGRQAVREPMRAEGACYGCGRSVSACGRWRAG